MNEFRRNKFYGYLDNPGVPIIVLFKFIIISLNLQVLKRKKKKFPGRLTLSKLVKEY